MSGDMNARSSNGESSGYRRRVKNITVLVLILAALSLGYVAALWISPEQATQVAAIAGEENQTLVSANLFVDDADDIAITGGPVSTFKVGQPGSQISVSVFHAGATFSSAGDGVLRIDTPAKPSVTLRLRENQEIVVRCEQFEFVTSEAVSMKHAGLPLLAATTLDQPDAEVLELDAEADLSTIDQGVQVLDNGDIAEDGIPPKVKIID